MRRYQTLLAALAVCGCASTEPSKPIGMPNPASAYCVKQDGKLEIRSEPGGQVGYCHLPDGRVTEEWALFRAAHS